MAAPDDRMVFDAADLLQRIGGDQELFDLLLVEYRSLRAELSVAVRAAADRQDANALEHAAHDLKGMLLALSGNPAADAAQTLELAGRTGQLTDTKRDVERLQAHLAAFDAAIEHHAANRRAA